MPITLGNTSITSSTGKVGIGSGFTPATALHAQSSDSEADRSLRLAYDATYFSEIRQLGAGGLGFRNNTTNNLMVIDGSGRVTIPNQPAFRVYDATAADGASTISFGAKDSNFSGRDSGFNLATGLFTAPVAGVYFFSFALLHGNGGSATYVRVLFKINGSASVTYGETLNDFTSANSYVSSSMGMAFRLAANDTVGLYNEGRKIYNAPYGSFSGFLLG